MRERRMLGDRFLIVSHIGRGNMGVVNRAEDTTVPPAAPDREVAVKEILRSRSGGGVRLDREAIARFEREVRIMQRVEHPGLPRLIAGGVTEPEETEGHPTPYLAMELFDGYTLDVLIDEERIPVPWVAAIGAQIADALEAAHTRDVVHRDLKPTNVMLLRGGRVKVLDFGMGLIIDDPDSTGETSHGVRGVGTARYMAPEQFASTKVTAAADLYALGCVLYELLTGIAPFVENDLLKLQRKHVSEPVPSIRLTRPDTPVVLRRLIEEALLAKDPADRPVSAGEVRRALAALADPEDATDSRVAGWVEYDPRARLPSAAVASPTSVTNPGTRTPTAPPGIMDVFSLHDRLISEYHAFTASSTVIRDERIAAYLADDLDSKSQWPSPLLSLNPFFASGGTVAELAAEGLLHDECTRIFQDGKPKGATTCEGRSLTLRKHQREAIETAKSGESYVLTTGTGSGKSLAYIMPIVDRVLRERDAERAAGESERKRVRAIVVYPMNALANSQKGELEKYLVNGYGPDASPVTFKRYTGQENDEERKRILNDPPDILLTNYVMLELMLTRPHERTSLIRMARGLEFLVFDELHTYRGRQGADVALLTRRVREACQAPQVQCIGTSATMSSEGSIEQQREKVAEVATDLFGTPVRPANVITETLVRATEDVNADPGGSALPRVPADRLTSAPPESYDGLVHDPLARWIESRFGLGTDTAGRLVRREPATVEKAATELSGATGAGRETCIEAIRRTLEAGAVAKHPVNTRALFAFRLHQFLSKGDTVHTTLESPAERPLTRDYQREQPGSGGKILLPLAFCRECGQEYMSVWRTPTGTSGMYEPRRGTQTPPGDTTGEPVEGYLYVAPDRPWPKTVNEVLDDRRLPDSWLESDATGRDVIRKSFQGRLPRSVSVDPFGFEGGELEAAFIPAPFLFCLHCGVSYQQVRGSDFAKLASLDQEGRSSATSLVSASVIRSLKEVPAADLNRKARKLLSFVDNRQDAALQAGHFNDFVQVTELRGALYRALVDAGEEGLTHDHLARRVEEALQLGPEDFVDAANLKPGLLRKAQSVLREVVGFRLYRDLQRGWRVTMPNLEQTGLLRVEYEDLDDIARDEQVWEGAPTALRSADPDARVDVMRTLLDEMRRSLAIDVPFFRDEFDSLRFGSERLSEPWQLTDNDRAETTTAYPRPSGRGQPRSGLYLSGRHKFGKYLGRYLGVDDVDERQATIVKLLTILSDAGLLSEVTADPSSHPGPRFHRSDAARQMGYQISSDCLIWKAGDGRLGVHDPLTRTYAAGQGPRVNTFWRDMYRDAAQSLTGLVAHEHTAQVDPLVREERERAFTEAELKMLYCSPTMELGVDIAELNAVMMRNVPPTPANYAQRSGRAGRSGQPALVITYCATGNSHDQYYFRRSEKMVSGVVQPPRLDLSNEDMVKAHVRAVWLAETGVRLGSAIPHVIELDHDDSTRRPAPRLPLNGDVAADIADSGARRRAVEAVRGVLGDLAERHRSMLWWDDDWLERVVRHAPSAFELAFDRWRDLYRAALLDREEQHGRILDHSLTERDRNQAKNRRREAETQLALLKNESQDGRTLLSDFNPYRYLASEGFLPGYSFPRLPLAAYVPLTGRRKGDGDYLQRPRFLAIREFGPGALIYHEGSRYQVTRVQLRPDANGDLTTNSARRCEHCGYHHAPEERADKCKMCDERLGKTTHNLLQLQTVFTRHRARISSDEEERRRAGFRLVTSYRFNRSGERVGRQDAKVSDGAGAIAELTYGDSATVRITNLGRLRRKSDDVDGFWLDPDDGRWLNAAQADGATGESGDIPLIDQDGAERRRKRLVIPFVEDRRNIAVLRLVEAVPKEKALSLMYALERGIEAAFELEDSELTGELLPPDDGPRDRMLFTEAAEGGAGVLRRLHDESGALARAAEVALEICHFTKDGTDTAAETCARGCYDCLLTYGNQTHHGLVDRHAVRDLLLRLAASEALPTGAGVSRTGQQAKLDEKSETSLETEFTNWLKEHGYRLPDDGQVLIPGVLARPDFIYSLPGARVAVFIDGPVHDRVKVMERDAAAEERLEMAGWDVVRIRYDDDWEQVVSSMPSYFGTGNRR